MLVLIRLCVFGFFFMCMQMGYSQNNLDKLREYVNDGQLVVYTESSIVLDSSSSAITYVDFCSDGTYYYSYDGSFNVKGSQNTSNRNNRAS